MRRSFFRTAVVFGFLFFYVPVQAFNLSLSTCFPWPCGGGSGAGYNWRNGGGVSIGGTTIMLPALSVSFLNSSPPYRLTSESRVFPRLPAIFKSRTPFASWPDNTVTDYWVWQWFALPNDLARQEYYSSLNKMWSSNEIYCNLPGNQRALLDSVMRTLDNRAPCTPLPAEVFAIPPGERSLGYKCPPGARCTLTGYPAQSSGATMNVEVRAKDPIVLLSEGVARGTYNNMVGSGVVGIGTAALILGGWGTATFAPTLAAMIGSVSTRMIASPLLPAIPKIFQDLQKRLGPLQNNKGAQELLSETKVFGELHAITQYIRAIRAGLDAQIVVVRSPNPLDPNLPFFRAITYFRSASPENFVKWVRDNPGAEPIYGYIYIDRMYPGANGIWTMFRRLDLNTHTSQVVFRGTLKLYMNAAASGYRVFNFPGALQ